MNNIYELRTNYDHYTTFLEKFDDVDNTFVRKYWGWINIDMTKYEPIVLNSYRNQEGIKNFKMDICEAENCLLILSERATGANRSNNSYYHR